MEWIGRLSIRRSQRPALVSLLKKTHWHGEHAMTEANCVESGDASREVRTFELA